MKMVTELSCDSLRAHRWKTGHHNEVTDKNQDVSGVMLMPAPSSGRSGRRSRWLPTRCWCSRFMRGTRPHCHICLPATTACDHSQRVALTNRPPHAAGPFVTGRLAHGHRLSGHTAFSTAPPGAKLSDMQFVWHVDLCYFPSTSASAHEVGDPHTYLKPHT